MLATPEMVMLLNDRLTIALAERDALFVSRRRVLATLIANKQGMAVQNLLLCSLLALCDEATLNSLPPDMRALAMRHFSESDNGRNA